MMSNMRLRRGRWRNWRRGDTVGLMVPLVMIMVEKGGRLMVVMGVVERRLLIYTMMILPM